MAVHAIWGYVAPDSGMTDADIQTEIDDWSSKLAKWEDSEWNAEVSRANTEEDGTGEDYARFLIHIDSSEPKDNTLQKCADKFKNKVDWFYLVYHVCDHDEQSRSGCSWDERWEWEDPATSAPAPIADAVPDAPSVTTVT